MLVPSLVALRKESVDRNKMVWSGLNFKSLVALRKESVDRNGLGVCHYRDDVSSLSARRAWIEITLCPVSAPYGAPSLSARRAWIEIPGFWRITPEK